jgi:hypothetical protein
MVLLRQWTHDYQEWRDWYLQWRNRPEPGMFSSRARQEPPVPPAWLPSMMTQQIAQTRAAVESPRETLWWERVHLNMARVWMLGELEYRVGRRDVSRRPFSVVQAPLRATRTERAGKASRERACGGVRGAKPLG